LSENTQSRREFLEFCRNSLAGVVLVGVVAPVINSCGSSRSASQVAKFTITVSVASLTHDNMAVRTQTPDGNDMLIVRHSPTNYGAVLLICSHKGCYGSSLQLSEETITCSCHGAQFNLNGIVQEGPANTNLTTYRTAFNQETKSVTIYHQ